MINLELTNTNTQRVVDINKINYLLIGNYDGYIKFYTYFYECLINKNKDFKIRIDNNVIDSKNTILFDFTSIYNMFLALELKKGSLLYEHVLLKLSSLDESWIEKFDELFFNLTSHLNDVDEGYNYLVNEDLQKIITQCIDITYDKENIVKVFKQLLDEYLENCLSKKIIIFIDSSIVEFDFNSFDNVFVFDISNHVELKKYNLISLDEVKELDFEIIKSKICDDYPIELDKTKVNKLISTYYRYLLCSKIICAHSEDEVIVYTLLSKYNKINQIVTYESVIIRDNIKSFLSNI